MKKFIILAFVALAGVGLVLSNISSTRADEARVIKHSTKAFTSSTSVSQSKVIYRITGVATGSPGVFGIYNTSSLALATDSNIAIEGGEATSGDPINMDFGSEGITLDSGSTVVISSCKIVIEYI